MLSKETKVLLIANPVAQNGAGARAAERATNLLRDALGRSAVSVLMTCAAGHAQTEAARSGAFDVVLALGGDGVIHEAANGLMELPGKDRPTFGIIPVGSGNDYARTLGMSANSVETAVSQLLSAREQTFDIGRVNEHYFVETLSFGLDAAIALDTVDRRVRTGKTGTMLYLESGIDQLLYRLDLRHYSASVKDYHAMGSHAASSGLTDSAATNMFTSSAHAVDVRGRGGRVDGDAARLGEPACASSALDLEGDSYLFAVQVGQTYGGGFRICPEASTTDGLLDVCIAHPPLGRISAVFIFLLAKNAHHTRFKQIESFRTSALSLSFDAPLPVQIDGERLVADNYEISCIPQALRVLIP